MRWQVRFALSLGCALTADLLVCLANQRGDGFIGIQDPHWYGAFTVAAVTLIFAIPGWLIFLILVFGLPDPKGWRFALFAVLGCLIGPGFLYANYVRAVLVHTFDSLPRPGGVEAAATAVSTLTTLLYLGLLKLLARKRITSN